MRLWRDGTEICSKCNRDNQVSTYRDELIRHNSFYLPEYGRSRDGYLYSPENRQIASFTFHRDKRV